MNVHAANPLHAEIVKFAAEISGRTFDRSVIAVCGGRAFINYTLLVYTMRHLAEELEKRDRPISFISHGNARGADRLAGTWARTEGFAERALRAQWNEYGDAAGPRRNQELLELWPKPHGVVAFPGGDGTADMIIRSRQQGFPVLDVEEILDS